MCSGQRVLHVGCVDSPIFNPESNLHLSLLRSGVCTELIGVDTDEQGIRQLASFCDRPLYTDLTQINQPVDIVLIPEVLEHVGNVATFLEQIDQLDFKNVIITVPDAVSCHPRHFDFAATDEIFVEIVHPDHNYWFTPYTLLNVLRKYTDWNIKGMFFFNNISLLTIASKNHP